jgi:hypothetical protein
MLNPSRACCCVASPCACGAGPETYLPVTGSQFIYEIAFPGSTGVVQVDQRCNDVQIVVEDVTGYIDDDDVVHGLYCGRCSLDFQSTPECTNSGGACVSPTTTYAYCNSNTITPINAANAYILDIGVERETTTCGFDLNNQTALLIYVDIAPYPNFCEYPISYGCSPPGNVFPCVATTSTVKCRLLSDDIGEIQFRGSGLCCHAWQINSTRVQSGLSVEAPYSSAGTLRFTWAGSTASSGWVASLTSSTNGPDGNPTISTAGCSYRHRTRATNACANADATTGGCSGTTMAAGVGCGACTFTDCCCQTEIAIQFKVWQRYYTRGWTSQTTFGNLSGPTSVSNTVTAYYRGCHDQRLYSTSTSAGATRVFKLDRATMTLGSVPLISAIQYRKPPGVTIEDGTDCLAWSLYTEADPATVYSLSTVTDSTSCTCTTPGGCNALTRDAAIARGVPEEITVTRITP